MIKNYFKVAWRNIIRNKGFSTINIAGLALGMTCSLLIMLWVFNERSIDNFHDNGKQLYYVYERTYNDGKVDAAYTTQGLLADELKRTIPEVQYASSMDYASAGTGNTFEAGNKVLKEYGSYAGADFFKMFSYPLLEGTAATVLNAPEAVVISRKMAENFFGSVDQAVGKTMRYDNGEELVVTGVFENVPANSSVKFDFLRSWAAFVKENDWVHNWGNTSPVTLIQLRKDADPVKVKIAIKDFIYRYVPKSNASKLEMDLQPYFEKYLYSNFKNGKPDGGRIEYVILFTWIAIFILLIACINFMNLATARSAKRAKEVGLRKVVGASRFSLTAQFIGEAMLLTLLSVIVAIILSALLLPVFNELTGKSLSLPVSQPSFWVALAILLIGTGFVAGSYPAFFLSSLNPVRVFKGGLKFSWSTIFFRKGLVVFQFALSIILIVGMIVIYCQVKYIQNKNMGYDRENLLYIPIEGDLIKKYDLFKEQVGKVPGIISVSKMRNSPTVIEHHTGSINWPGKDQDVNISFADAVVGYDFIKTMKLQLKAGRDFSKEFADSTSFIVNETAVNKIGYTDPIGKTVVWGNRRGMITGVVKDFHFNSMHNAIDPLIIRLDENWGWGTILIRMQAGNPKERIAELEKICKALNPQFPFTYQFSDQEFAKLYKSEALISKLSNYFALLAIFISCLGLFGLATFTAVQRTKEIGVRKVLGASVINLASLLSKDFIKLVLIAVVIASPVAWWVMNNWLQGFAYRVQISWWVFVVAAIAALLIALFTVSFQAIKAAIANPVKSLRTE